MFIRKLASLAAAAALGLLALGQATAPAHTALRLDPGNLPFTGSTTITNTTSDHFTFATQSGSITCKEAYFDLDVERHTSPTSITGTLTSLTFTSCTDTLPLVTILDCSLHPPNLPTIHIVADRPTGGDITITDLIIRCAIAAGSTQACYYTSTDPTTGIYDNAKSSLSYENIHAVSVTPTTDALPHAFCGTTGNWSVTFTHIVQGGTNRTVTITTA